jgi:hypothetical protein
MPGGQSKQNLVIELPLTGLVHGLELPVNVSAPFSEKWLEAVKQTSACKTWYKSTDELLFDICEPR